MLSIELMEAQRSSRREGDSHSLLPPPISDSGQDDVLCNIEGALVEVAL